MPSTGEDRRLTAQGSIDRADRLDLADALMAVLESKLSHRTIRSFFTVEVASNGYRLWNPHLRAPKDSGSALVRHSIQTDAGHVSVDMMRYADEEQTHVRAYEWCAELREDGSSELPDAEALIDAGDLAFVWLWERRSGTRPGAGQACLRAALTDLRRRQRRIRTVIVDLKPYPYVVSDSAGTPATVHIEKLEAMDRLQAFVDELQLDRLIKGRCRSIVNRDSDDANAAMRVLGLAGLEQQNSPRQDGG